MGNKRNLQRRNKKPNNWKIRNVKKSNENENFHDNSKYHENLILPTSNESYNIDEQGYRDVQLYSLPEEHIVNFVKDDDADHQENVNTDNNLATNQEEGRFQIMSYNASDNYYSCLAVGDEATTNFSANHNKTQAVNDDDDDECEEDEYVENNNDDDDEGSNDTDDNGNRNEGCDNDNANNEYMSAEEDNALNDEENVFENEKLVGRRLFEIDDLFEQIKRISQHSKTCGFGDMVLQSEMRRGLNSTFKFKCQKCGVIRKIESCPKKKNAFSCNEDAVLGINSIGSGFYHLQEFLTTMNVPCFSNTTYDSINKNQQSDWWELAKKSAFEALQEEIALAKSCNMVDSKGNALIAVICDGGWGKRSYGKAFNSLSGCAVLIGLRTKKVVFFDVRNKYCHTCKIAQSKESPVNDHKCNKNYSGPSAGMEADIILEGFKKCEEYGARFYRLIADGDSSTYKAIRDKRVYKNPDLFVEKLECVNHLSRNFRSKFGFLNKITKFNVGLRKLVTNKRGQDIVKGIKKAAEHWRESDIDYSEKLDNLEDDILNAPSHYFGVHTNCKSYFCQKETEQGAVDNMNLMKEDGLYYEVMNLIQTYFAGNAKSLIEDNTNNAAEEFNNVVAKYLGGKRINFSLAGSYTARVAAAVVQYNTGGHAGSEFRKFKFGNLPSTSGILKLENGRKRKLVKNETARNVKPRTKFVPEETSSGAYYHGDGTETLDMAPKVYENAKKEFLNRLEEDQKNRDYIQKITINHKRNTNWHERRQKLLPSSHFARIAKAISPKSYKIMLDDILYKRSEFGNSAEKKHDRLVQREALSLFTSLHKDQTIFKCGLFIDKDLPYLCASPFRLYGNDQIISIKCPLKFYNKKFDDVIENIPFWKKVGGSLVINKKSDWYIELQGKLHVTDRKLALMMVWLSESEYKVIEVSRDETFFETKVRPKLIYFYTEVMLKELVNSRDERHMELRAYNTATNTFI